jgi:AbrB family looped-hinge helix DNA binding protein
MGTTKDRGMKSVAVKVSASGRMHLPSEVRKALGIEGPGHVVLTLEDGALTLRTMAQALADVRRLARPFAPKDRLASEQLIAERREEARKEAAIPAAAQKPRRRRSG